MVSGLSQGFELGHEELVALANSELLSLRTGLLRL